MRFSLRGSRLHVERIRLQNEYPARALERPARRQAQHFPHLPDGREGALGQNLREVRMEPTKRPAFRGGIASSDQRGPEPLRHSPLAHAGRTVEQIRLGDFTSPQHPPE